jgi:tRNA (guanine-N(7)-)-methyltransferase subunit TRM82
MQHPFQSVVADPATQLVFVAVKNQIRAFKFNLQANRCTLVGSWVDTVGPDAVLKKQHLEKIKQLELQRKSDDEPIKVPKIPKPGPGAPPIQLHIRSLDVFRHGDTVLLIATTDNDKAVVVFHVDAANPENVLVERKRQPLAKRPCSISIDHGLEHVIVADKFGDVYRLPTGGSVQDEKLLAPLLGHVSMLTDVVMAQSPAANGAKQFIITADRDEHIRVSNYPKLYVIKHWLFGHREYVSTMLTMQERLLVSGGGDDYVCLWNWCDNELLDTASLRTHLDPYFTEFHQTPERFLTPDSLPEISVAKILPVGADTDGYVVVLVENVKCLLLLQVANGKIVHRQTLASDHPFVDVCRVGETQLLGASDTENGELLRMVELVDGALVPRVAPVAGAESIEVESRAAFCPLWYVNTLRKRSEH